jgi:hypothetical protein
LGGYAAAKTVQMQREDSDIFALQLVRNHRCLDPNGVADPLVMPQVNRPDAYYRAMDRYGPPPQLLSFASGSQDDVARAVANLLRRNCV